jgi:lipopolysaccharide export system ATP-binding protein
VIVGLVRPNEGTVFLDEIDITKVPMYKRAQMGIGYLPQEVSVFRKLSVEDNIMCILELKESSKVVRINILEQLLNEFSLTKFRFEKASHLSGGQKRRVEIARLIASKPKFVLLDEPLAGVDPIAIKEIRFLIQKLKTENIGVLITDHNVRETLMIVDRCYIVYDGSILVSGSKNDVINHELTKQIYLGDSFA